MAIDDHRLEELARQKGVGAHVMPKAESRAGEGVPEPLPASAIAKDEPVQAAATPRADMKAVSVELPVYVWTELKIRAAHRQSSVRHVIMTALKADGITIEDADMIEDGRRNRSPVT